MLTNQLTKIVFEPFGILFCNSWFGKNWQEMVGTGMGCLHGKCGFRNTFLTAFDSTFQHCVGRNFFQVEIAD